MKNGKRNLDLSGERHIRRDFCNKESTSICKHLKNQTESVLNRVRRDIGLGGGCGQQTVRLGRYH